MKTKFSQIYQFCDTVLAWKSFDGPSEWVCLNNDLTESVSFIINEQIDQLSFAQGGITVFHNAPFTKAVVIDLVCLKMYQSDDVELSQLRIKNNLQLGECGLSLSDEVLMKIVDKEFFEKRSKM